MVTQSHGVAVARLAGVPSEVAQRARDILDQLHRNRTNTSTSNPSAKVNHDQASNRQPATADEATKEEKAQASTIEIISANIGGELVGLQLDEVSPRQAWQMLSEWKQRLAQSEHKNVDGEAAAKAKPASTAQSSRTL